MPEATFEVTLDAFMLDGLTIVQTKSTAVRLIRSNSLIAKSNIDDIVILFDRTGNYTIDINDKTFSTAAGDAMALDLAQPVSINSDGIDCLALILSRRRLGELVPQLDEIHGCILPATALRRLLADHVDALTRAAPQLSASECESAGESTIRLAAACLGQLPRRQVDSRGGSVTLAAIKSSIEQRLDQPDLGPDTLMQQFALSRSTLYRLFEPVGGVKRYIAERRLRRAFQMLSNPNVPAVRISQLAYDMGFSSPTSFGSAFRHLFGITPREARASAHLRMDAGELRWFASEPVRQFIKPL